MELTYTIIQLLLYLWSSHITIIIASWEQNGFSSISGVRFISKYVCWGIHLMIFITGVWFWDSTIGIILFLLDIFSVTNSTYGWVFSLSWLSKNSYYSSDKLVSIKYVELFITFVIYLVFTIICFLNTPRFCATKTVLYSTRFLLIAIIVSCLSFIINRIIIKKYSF